MATVARTIAIVGLAPLFGAHVAAQEFGNLQIRTTEPHGYDLVERHCSLFDWLRRERLVAESPACTFESLPFRRYWLRVSAPGFQSHEQGVSVYGENSYVRAVLWISGGEPDIGGTPIPYNRLIGKLEGATSPHIVVRVAPLFGNSGVTCDAVVKSDGRFDCGGLDNGEYVLLVVADEPESKPRLMVTRQVTIASRITEVSVLLPPVAAPAGRN